MQINGNKDKDFNPITVAICRDMFRYDANEIVPKNEGDSNGDNKQGQHRSKG